MGLTSVIAGGGDDHGSLTFTLGDGVGQEAARLPGVVALAPADVDHISSPLQRIQNGPCKVQL
jgi:hypothetical protein